jgi:hypothetical protein
MARIPKIARFLLGNGELPSDIESANENESEASASPQSANNSESPYDSSNPPNNSNTKTSSLFSTIKGRVSYYFKSMKYNNESLKNSEEVEMLLDSKKTA